MAQTTRKIVTEVHDEPHLEGRRVTVRRIQALVEERGLPAAEVARMHDLELADVYAALTYYYEHPEEMEQVKQEREQVRERSVRDEATSLDEIRREHDDNAFVSD